MREEIIKEIEKNKIIVIVRGVKKGDLIPFAEAVYKGGIRLLEITYSADSSVSDEETAENIKMLSEHFKGRMLIGAGTVLSEKQVELTQKAGGKFIISPDSYDKVIKKTVELGMVSIPGAFTATEMQQAHRSGADFIKIFPTVNVGASYIKNVKAPLSHLKLLAVGGITPENMKEFSDAGVCGFGIGSNITNRKLIEAGEFDKITELANEFVRGL